MERWSATKAWWFTLFSSAPPSNRAIVEFTGVGPGDRVLDVGCGPGAALENAASAGADCHGVDPSPSMVKRAAARVPGAVVREGSAESIPFDDATFTHVWSIASFHHWADTNGGLDEIERVLAPGGKVFIVERKLKKGRIGHGLNRVDAMAVAENLTERGLLNATVSPMRAGRSDYVVVSGVTPAA